MTSDQSLPRHAVLLTVHRDPLQVSRLIKALEHPRISVFLHVDSAVDIAPFLALNAEHVPYRIRTEWGTFAMVDCCLRWLRANRRSGYSTYSHLSGQCFPLVPANELVERLDGLQGPGVGLNDAPEAHSYRYRIFQPRTRSGPLHFLDRAYRKLRYRGQGNRRLPDGLVWSVGCSFWCFGREPVEWMLELADSRPEIERFFRHTFAPDETFFHTLLASSPWAGTPYPDPHYIDWSQGGDHPRTLDEGDLPKMLDSGAWFARKVDSSISASLLDRLESSWKVRKDSSG